MSFSKLGLQLSRGIVRASRPTGILARSIGGAFARVPSVCNPRFTQIRTMSNEEPITLPSALAAEIADEAANDEVDQEYLESREATLKKFKLQESEGSGIVRLSRSADGEQIVVSFNCQDEEEDFESNFSEDAEVEVEDEPDGAYGINFEVNITKGDLGSLNFKCIAANAGELVIKNLQFVPKGKSVEDIDLYEGPRFDQLSDTLQGGARSYLEERLVDGDLCYFVLTHASQKEQKEYVNWLNKLLEFSDK